MVEGGKDCVVGKKNIDTILPEYRKGVRKSDNKEVRWFRFFVSDDQKPNTISIFECMYPIYKNHNGYHIKFNKERFFNGCYLVEGENNPISEAQFNLKYDAQGI